MKWKVIIITRTGKVLITQHKNIWHAIYYYMLKTLLESTGRNYVDMVRFKKIK